MHICIYFFVEEMVKERGSSVLIVVLIWLPW